MTATRAQRNPLPRFLHPHALRPAAQIDSAGCAVRERTLTASAAETQAASVMPCRSTEKLAGKIRRARRRARSRWW
jgi:hypothetical protein